MYRFKLKKIKWFLSFYLNEFYSLTVLSKILYVRFSSWKVFQALKLSSLDQLIHHQNHQLKTFRWENNFTLTNLMKEYLKLQSSVIIKTYEATRYFWTHCYFFRFFLNCEVIVGKSESIAVWLWYPEHFDLWELQFKIKRNNLFLYTIKI